jgi:hypothetical protein
MLIYSILVSVATFTLLINNILIKRKMKIEEESISIILNILYMDELDFEEKMFFINMMISTDSIKIEKRDY